MNGVGAVEDMHNFDIVQCLVVFEYDLLGYVAVESPESYEWRTHKSNCPRHVNVWWNRGRDVFY